MLPSLLASVLLPLALASGDSTPKFVAPKSIAELEKRINRVLDSAKVPGVGLAIVRHDSVIYAGGLGLARVSPAVPATAATLFRIGSTSKAFVALTALALEREGKHKLTDPLRQHLPTFYFDNPWEATDPVRLVNLLEHTSGFDDNSLMSYANNDPTPLSLAAGLALDSATRVSRRRPGTRFSYCNTGPAIVARLIEQIEGKPWEQIVQERWFTPMGMSTATYLRPDSAKVVAATLYRADGTTAVPYWHVFARPAGSINASATDMSGYLRFLLGRGTVGGKALLPGEALDRMERSEASLGAREGFTVGYGLHMWRATDSTGYTWTMHGGGVEGGLSDLSYMPAYGVGYAFQINAGNGAAYRQIAKLVRAFVTLGLTPPERPAVAKTTAGVRDRFEGWYHTVSPRMQHLYFLERIVSVSRVTITDTSLTLTPLFDKAEVGIPVDSTHFREAGEGAATMALVVDTANGRPAGIETMGGGLGTSWERVSTAQALTNIVLAALWLAGLLLTIAAALFGVVRWIARKVRKRPTPLAAAASAWWVALAAAVALLTNVILLSVGMNDLHAIGTLTGVSGGSWGAGVVFLALALIGVFVAWRGNATATRWERVSLVTVRLVLALNFVAATYLAWWGYIGWRTWG